MRRFAALCAMLLLALSPNAANAANFGCPAQVNLAGLTTLGDLIVTFAFENGAVLNYGLCNINNPTTVNDNQMITPANCQAYYATYLTAIAGGSRVRLWFSQGGATQDCQTLPANNTRPTPYPFQVDILR